MRTVIALTALLLACTDFRFAEDLTCSAGGNCPEGFFCETSVQLCRHDLASCGNGVVDGDEVCDDGNRTSGDGCRADCLKAEICGDGVLDPQEVCEDGNAVGGDGCAADCSKLEGCGDGVLDDGEECDDGAANAETGACLPTCLRASCGDGFVRAGVEACDLGAGNSFTGACLPTCVVATCGDGHVQAGVEACDDGNLSNTDGCPQTCAAPTCGDGFLQIGVELCDDANPTNGDGCNTDCRTSGVVQVVAGTAHTCTLRASGTVRCWGAGANGRLGYGNTTTIGDNEHPANARDVIVGGTVTQIAAGDAHTCALLATGNVRCWGAGADGRLGYGNVNSIGDDETPASAGDVPVGGTVTQIAAGAQHTCALLATGAVRCWGRGLDGRLGYGNTATIGDDETPASAGDIDVGSVVEITAGEAHTCARLANGDVRCWGAGANGRLGYGNTNAIGDDETPASAGSIDLGAAATQISAGAAHTCARLATGKVRCWGVGANGRLGRAATADIGDNEIPNDVAGDVDLGGNAARVAAGGRHTCALLDNGTLRCWGDGTGGRLGYGNPTTIGDDEAPAVAGDVPVDGAFAKFLVGVAAGGAHTCALLDTGAVRCWGANASGQLGYASTAAIGDNEPASSAGDVFLFGVVQLAAGDGHTCALLDTGTVRCWGGAGGGKLGYPNLGTNEGIGDNETPAEIGDVDVGGPVIQLAAGSGHTCAILVGGAVRCWGDNFTGQLGYGNTTTIGDNETPASAGDVDVGGPVIQLSAGFRHTCALMATGAVRCWGRNGSGQLGRGNTTNIGDDETPASAGDIDLGGTAVEIGSGSDHTCARMSDGTVRCWGAGDSGRLGYGNQNNIGDNETPASAGVVDVGGTVVQLAVGLGHTCVRLVGGAVRCWGASGQGALGYGVFNDIGDNEVPSSAGNVPVGAPVVSIGAGQNHTCAVLDTGALRCWGAGGDGQLGYANHNNIGDDETPSSAGDVVVGGPVVRVALAAFHTCALLTRGRVRCWGFGAIGRLGYGNSTTIGDDETPATAGDVPVF